MDEHGAACSDGFVDGCAAGFADDEVVFGEKLWDFASPSEQADTTGVCFFDFAGAGLESAEVFSHDDGDLDIGRGIEDGASMATDKWLFRGREVEYAEGLAGVILADGF